MSRTSIICVGCPKGCRIKIEDKDGKITDISGHSCEKGKEYAREEFKNPTRILPTTVIVNKGELPLVSVKTAKPIPKKYLLPAMKEIAKARVEAPVNIGDVIIDNILDTGVDIIATNNVNKS